MARTRGTPDRPPKRTQPDVPSVPAPPRRFPVWWLLAVLVVAAIACFWNLGVRALWQDEGETAVLASSILSNGVPKALNGGNLILQRIPGYNKDYVWTFHPWGQFYAAAASVALFGRTAWAARLPFALCGVLTVGLTFVFVQRHWKNTATATLCALLLATTATFVLHSRQCRYYALSALTCLLVVAAFLELMLQPRRKWAVLWGLTLAMQFYADFGTLPALAPGLAVSLLVLRARRRQLVAAGGGAGLAILLCLPGLILHRDRLLGEAGSEHNVSTALLAHLCYLDGWFIPLLVLLPATVLLILSRLRRAQPWTTSERTALAVALIMFLGLAAMARIVPAPHMRYVVPLLSLAKIVLGLILMRLYAALKSRIKMPLVPAAIVGLCAAVLTGTSVASVPLQWTISLRSYYVVTPDYCTARPPYVRFELAGLIHELTHDFVSADRVALNVVNDLIRPNEVVLTTYGDLPLMFYRPDLRIRSAEGGEATLPKADERPDMILALTSAPAAFKSYADGLFRREPYQRIQIPIPYAPYGNIPEPRVHYFATPPTVPGAIFLRQDLASRLSGLPRDSGAWAAHWYARRS